MKCSQAKCESEACWSYVWPGRPDRMFACDPCRKRAEGVAEAMGFPLGDLMLIDSEGNRSIFDDVDEGR